jgi:hypothetical protein
LYGVHLITVSLSDNVRLDVTIIVLAGPNEATAGLECLGNHVVNETVLIPDVGSFVILLVSPVINYFYF